MGRFTSEAFLNCRGLPWQWPRSVGRPDVPWCSPGLGNHEQNLCKLPTSACHVLDQCLGAQHWFYPAPSGAGRANCVGQQGGRAGVGSRALGRGSPCLIHALTQSLHVPMCLMPQAAALQSPGHLQSVWGHLHSAWGHCHRTQPARGDLLGLSGGKSCQGPSLPQHQAAPAGHSSHSSRQGAAPDAAHE